MGIGNRVAQVQVTRQQLEAIAKFAVSGAVALALVGHPHDARGGRGDGALLVAGEVDQQDHLGQLAARRLGRR